MPHIEGPAYTGVLSIDLAAHKGILVDLPPNSLKGARGEQEGLPEVLAELDHAVPTYGDEAEIHHATHQRIVQATKDIEALAKYEVVLDKMLEVVRESRKRLVNNRENDISAIGAQAEDRATRGKKPELAAHFEKTIAYRSQIADKAANTRKKNESAKTDTPAATQAEIGG
jgi:hypothetical protein